MGVIIISRIPAPEPTSSMQLQELAEAIRAGEVQTISMSGDEVSIEFKANRPDGKLHKEAANSLAEQLTVYGITAAELEEIEFEVVPPSNYDEMVQLALYIVPVILVAGFIWYMYRQTRSANNQAFSIGRSKARMADAEQPTVTFDDVAGTDEAKQELAEIVEFLKEPDKFIQLGARIPKGVLMVGPPGCGKTLMAKAVSGEAGVPFFSISGSEFVEMFVGVGASRVRDLFDQAKRHSPCIVFVDEIDAVGRHRGAGLGHANDEREQTLNQILVEMDGFGTDTNVIVVAATNRPDILDPALLRPGRFDRRVVLDRPDIRGRRAILDVHVRGKPLGDGIDLDQLARNTPGFVGADIENTVNEAAILAARRNKKTIGMAEFEEAVERVVAGPERRSRILSDKEKRIVAYHEAGHAIVSRSVPHGDPVQKISIISRGEGLGYTVALPTEDRYLGSRARFRDKLAYILGGRAAEEIVFGEMTTGSGNDLERVTELARAMVTRYGMSDKLGPMAYGKHNSMIFLGRELGEQRDYSERVAQEIDVEVRRIVTEAYQRARAILTEKRERLEAVAQRLLRIETIGQVEFEALYTGKALPPEPLSAQPDAPPPPPPRVQPLPGAPRLAPTPV
ncbi:MAG: ATP-dependent zinc metalloprotease FtsH [Thermoflexales bacterium]|nr:ATP-dependent zinc metalloprotease FtsH [Thermoflexales bacterium]